MSFSEEKRNNIQAEIIMQIYKENEDFIKYIMGKYNISRQTISRYLVFLEKLGFIESENKGKAKKYKIKEKKFSKIYKIKGLEEDKVWNELKEQFEFIEKQNENVYKIIRYGFTEILNNAIEHSESNDVLIQIITSNIYCRLCIIDKGIGIFNKIREHFNLENIHESVLKLHIGKTTTDPKKHTGEGIFFTSKAFDVFNIYSDNLAFISIERDFIFDYKSKQKGGTKVYMEINNNSQKKLSEIFDKFTAEEDLGFQKTIIPLKVMEYEGEELISRSQARRLIVNFEKFKEIVLNFEGVKEIGQAFTDEIFRVFKNEHPDINLLVINTNDDINKMIAHVESNLDK